MGIRTAQELYDGESSSETTTTENASELQPSDAVAPKTETTEKVETKPVETQIAKPVEKTEDDDNQDSHVPDDLEGLKKALAAARGDKRKARKQWQETERKLAELTGKISVYQQHGAPKVEPVAPKAPEVPDLNDTNFFDPNELKRYVNYQATSIEKKLEKQFQDRSERAARKRHQDFDEVVNEFVAAAQRNPQLWEQFAQDDDPGEYAYQTGKSLKEFQGVGSIAELEAKIKAKVLAEIEAERNQQPTLTQQATAPQMPKPQPPKSLANVRGTGLGVKPEWRPRTAEQLYDS